MGLTTNRLTDYLIAEIDGMSLPNYDTLWMY